MRPEILCRPPAHLMTFRYLWPCLKGKVAPSLNLARLGRDERAVYVDSSAIVKLAVMERESAALPRYLRRHTPLVASAPARTEVARSLLPLGPAAVERGTEVLRRIELLRINDRVLAQAGSLLPAGLRSLDAIHLATRSSSGRAFSVSSRTTPGWLRPRPPWALRSMRRPGAVPGSWSALQPVREHDDRLLGTRDVGPRLDPTLIDSFSAARPCKPRKGSRAPSSRAQ